jgi:hypothetical protein
MCHATGSDTRDRRANENVRTVSSTKALLRPLHHSATFTIRKIGDVTYVSSFVSGCDNKHQSRVLGLHCTNKVIETTKFR